MALHPKLEDLRAANCGVVQNGYNRRTFCHQNFPTPMRPTAFPSSAHRYRGGVSARIGKGFVEA